MSNESFKIAPLTKKLMIKTLERCGDELDLSGWRYDKILGTDEYIKIDVNDDDKLFQFHVCLIFLKTFFSRKFHSETVYSTDLKSVVELWWAQTEKNLISIDNGIMLAAIVAKGLAPDDLWYSMNISQQAYISPKKWKKLCEKYSYKPNVEINVEDYSKDEYDTIKIN
jgi:hypothetical protein